MIWFKNAQIYRLSENFKVDFEHWQQAMSARLFSPCQQQQPVSLGWVSAIPDTSNLIHQSGRYALLCLQRQERLLPASVIREVLQEKVDLIRQQEDRRVGSKERQTLKDEVIFELLPKAFVRTSRIYCYIDTELHVLVVDAASEKRADEISGFLRETLGTLPVTVLQSHCQPAPVLTSWVRDENAVAEGWVLQPDMELTHSDNQDAKVKLKHVDFDSSALAAHLDESARVEQIAFEWQERLFAVINAKSQLKRIKYADTLTEQALNDGSDDKVTQADASFLLMASELSGIISDMIRHFGIDQTD